MITFRKEHIDKIHSGEKTATRRIWPKGPHARVGSSHLVKSSRFSKESFGRIRILRVYRQRLVDMQPADFRAEGYGHDAGTFLNVFKEINNQKDMNFTEFLMQQVWVIEFELEEETVGWEAAQKELDRRGTKFPDIEISAHAIDRASTRVLGVWQNTRFEDEGLYSWLVRMTEDAMKLGESDEACERFKYMNISFIVEQKYVIPVLKSVIYNGK